MKRKLFIGSSSEGKEIAQKLKDAILKECADWIEPIMWADIHNQIDLHKQKTKSKVHKKFLKKQRPVVFIYPSKEFWDIPTTLTTLNSVITHFVPQEEIGVNEENNEWVQHEIRNFVGALKHLISQNCKCEDNVIVEYLD